MSPSPSSRVRGLTAIEAGIALTAATLAWTTGSWIQAKLAPRYPPEHFVRVGFAVVIVGMALFLLILVPAVDPWIAMPTFALAGPRHGPRLRPALAHRPARGTTCRAGLGIVRLSLTDSLGRPSGPA